MKAIEIRGIYSEAGSNARYETLAKERFGQEGYEIACLDVALGKGSKRLIEAQIKKAGYDVAAVLKWAGEVYSMEGLLETCRKLLARYDDAGGPNK